MPILLFLLWLIFNERVTVDVLIIGLIVVAAVCLICRKIGIWDPQKDIKTLSKIPGMIGFVLRLVLEVFKANIHMIALVLSANPNERIHPKIVKHYTKIQSEGGRVALANSITLTPGTVTVDVADDYVYVHAIDEYAEEGLSHSVLEEKIERMEDNV
ncbi:MAG: Na+/H+ antiporter subunit E [Solobacterium sp.]|nr:Na+/H+ antiporter subunit E [Solobacterium sp.]